MPKIINGIEYLNTRETMQELGTPKKRFYEKVRAHLKQYHFDALETPWYRQSEVLALKAGKSTAKAIITLPGIFKDWTEYVRSLGMRAGTISGEIEITTLPEEAIALFNLPRDAPFVKRSRATLVDGAYICTWDTYYPLSLVSADLEQIKADYEYSVVSGIKARHGLVIGHTRERYSARLASLREQEQMQLVTNEPILSLQRASSTRDRKTLILYSDMALLGDWFAAEREYDVKIWDD